MVHSNEKVKLVLESAQDPASVSISAFLQEKLSFSPTDNPNILKAGEIYLLKTDKKHLYFDNIDEEISKLDLNIETRTRRFFIFTSMSFQGEREITWALVTGG